MERENIKLLVQNTWFVLWGRLHNHLLRVHCDMSGCRTCFQGLLEVNFLLQVFVFRNISKRKPNPQSGAWYFLLAIGEDKRGILLA